MQILEGKGTKAQQNVVAVNAAYALQCYFDRSLEECLEMANESINSAKAKQAFANLINISTKG